jgi:electron transport complex protein RnfC
MREMLAAGRVLIGIEDNKPEAIAAMSTAARAAGDDAIQVVVVPTRYPAGGAKQLIRVLTGIEVPHGERSTDYGVQCFNVGTAYAIHEAIALGQPLISRIVTVAGNVGQARNYEVLFGTPMRDLMALCKPMPDSDRVIMGGPMMGFRMPGDEVPVVKATNCVLVGSPSPVPAAAARNVLHPLRRMRQGLSGRPAALRNVLVRAGATFRQGPGIPPVRLHRVRLLRLCMPFAHSAGRLLPLRQE